MLCLLLLLTLQAMSLSVAESFELVQLFVLYLKRLSVSKTR